MPLSEDGRRLLRGIKGFAVATNGDSRSEAIQDALSGVQTIVELTLRKAAIPVLAGKDAVELVQPFIRVFVGGMTINDQSTRLCGVVQMRVSDVVDLRRISNLGGIATVWDSSQLYIAHLSGLADLVRGIAKELAEELANDYLAAQCDHQLALKLLEDQQTEANLRATEEVTGVFRSQDIAIRIDPDDDADGFYQGLVQMPHVFPLVARRTVRGFEGEFVIGDERQPFLFFITRAGLQLQTNDRTFEMRKDEQA